MSDQARQPRHQPADGDQSGRRTFTELADRVDARMDALGMSQPADTEPGYGRYYGNSNGHEEAQQDWRAASELGLLWRGHELVETTPALGAAHYLHDEAQTEVGNYASIGELNTPAGAEAKRELAAAREALEQAYDDEWVQGGWEAAHQAHLDELGHVNSDQSDYFGDAR